MNNKIKTLSAFTLSLMGSLAFADCKLEDVQKVGQVRLPLVVTEILI